MSRGSFVWDKEKGTFVEGKASPELVPEHMRGLPASWTTKDEAEGDKVHALDPPHIVEELVEKNLAAENPAVKKELTPALKALEAAIAPPGVVVPLNQIRIDLVRFRIIQKRVAKYAAAVAAGQECDLAKIDLVWFPSDNVNVYMLMPREKAPAKRPPHLRNYKLEIDIFNWPQSILDALLELGQQPPNIQEMIKDAKSRHSVVEEIRSEEDRLQGGGDNGGGDSQVLLN